MAAVDGDKPAGTARPMQPAVRNLHPLLLLATPVQARAADAAGGALEMLGSLIAVLAVIFALAWLARWLQGVRVARGASMQLQGGVQLGTKEKVVLLQVGEQQFLIGVAPGSVNLLHRFDEPVATALASTMASPLPSAFADRLRQALGGKTQQ